MLGIVKGLIPMFGRNHDEDARVNDEQSSVVVRDVEMIVAWVAFAAFVVINTFAQYGILFSWKTDDVKDAIFAWVSPSAYVSLIWVPIYVLLAVWLVRLSRTRHRGRTIGKSPFTITTAIFIVVMVFLVAWIFCWQARNYPAVLSLIVIATALTWLLWMVVRKRDASLWGWAPFSLLGSWLIVECISDIARACTYYFSKDGSISRVSQSIATVLVVALLLAVACVARYKFSDWIFGVVCLWSVIGIAVHLMDISKLTAVVCIVLATAAALIMYIPLEKLERTVTKVNQHDTVEQSADDHELPSHES